MFKSVPALYRDCLRTVEHMAAKSAKGRAIRAMVRQEFDKNRHVTDEAEIDSLKKKAVGALANYLSITSISQLQHVDGGRAAMPAGTNTVWLSDEEVEEMKRQVEEEQGVEWNDATIQGFTEVDDAVLLDSDDHHDQAPPHSSTSASH